MKYDLAIFDVDGTLLDTLDDLAAAVNHALAQHGLPPRRRDEVRRLIGNGIAYTVRNAVPEGTGDDVCGRVLADFRGYYLSHVNVLTRPFPGVMALVEALNAAGVRVAANSNKVDSAVNELCAAHFPGRIALALGERPEIPRKPAPDGVHRIIRALGASPKRTLYVGDGESDIRTAENAGIDCAWVSWGYRRRDELQGLDIRHAFDTAEELKAFLLGE